MLKKTTFAVLGVVISFAASAGDMGVTKCTSGNVTVPCASTNWDLDIQGLYLQPVYGRNLSYGRSHNEFKSINADWNWGMHLEGSWHYNTGSDISVNWSHLKTERDQGHFDGRYWELTPTGHTLTNSPFVLSMGNKFDQINVVEGQRINAGLLSKARFYGGLQYGRIQVYPSARFERPAAIGGNVTSTLDTTFNGLGPVIGIDYSYNLPHGLSLTANSAVSLLYGASKMNASTWLQNNLVVASLNGSRRLMVPSLETKLGANYAYEIAEGILNFEGGYQALNYFNVLQTGFANSDFGLYGPYFGLKWLGNA